VNARRTPDPVLSCEGPDPRTKALPRLYDAALETLLRTSTGPEDGLIRAGGHYPTPWTRDAAINTWYAAALLAPDSARRTLLSVCETLPDGRRVVQQDNQWWDRIIWAVGAWRYVSTTGDTAFLTEAYPIARTTLELLDAEHFDRRHGLYRGGAVMQDGISGYPEPYPEPGNPSSFVHDHAGTRTLMCLSTNAVYVLALRALAEMAEALGRPSGEAAGYRGRAVELAARLNESMWREEAGLYGYFLTEDGELAPHQEAMGLALAILSGIAGPARAARVLAGIHREPRGVVNVWPHFAGYDAERPGRHGAMCWPMVMGVWADAAARSGAVDVFGTTLADLVDLFTGSDAELFELYHATTGAVDGGWQSGRQWESVPQQTWSATTLLGAVHSGLLGLRPERDGLRVAPTVPAGWSSVRVRGLRWRDAVLDVRVVGSGTEVAEVRVDGVEVPVGGVVLEPSATGAHAVEATVR
jgi:glycogen debranching enzyme